MSEFDGLVALVTGGASGIGAATVSLLHERGARVVSLDLDTEHRGDADLAVLCDVSVSASVEQAVADVVREYGRVDVLVNNAGIGAVGDVTANDDDEWHRVLDVNVVGIARMTRTALPYLVQSPAAAIVNTCSIVNAVGVPQRALYSASKGAVAALTLAMAADLVGRGVRVNGVVPGTAETPWVERLLAASDDPAAMAAQLRARQPMGRLVTPQEVAHAIVYLAGPAASSTTGTLLPVDGGMTGLRVPARA
jgi:NAD(P)-dependent dehydrogenase (short-subunit alcohol dehydrogenase family)